MSLTAEPSEDTAPRPRGHWQLGVRGCVSAAQAALTLLLVASGDDLAHNPILAGCQIVSSASLFNQWRTGNPRMFVVRAVPSFVRCALLVHLAACGRCWPWEACDTLGWHDVRKPFRVIHVVAAVRMLLNGLSLLLQFLLPLRGVTDRRGNEQLFYRGCVRAPGVLIHLALGVLKLNALTGTKFERSNVEVAVNFARCFLIPISAWSLLHQWLDTGSSREAREEEDREDVESYTSGFEEDHDDVQEDGKAATPGPSEESPGDACGHGASSQSP